MNGTFCNGLKRITFPFSGLIFGLLTITVLAERRGLLETAVCIKTPVVEDNNCTYTCSILSYLNNLRAICATDQKTLITCDDGLCRRGVCRTTTCECARDSNCNDCNNLTVVRFCSETLVPRTTVKPYVISTQSYIDWWNHNNNRKDVIKKDESSVGFSWRTFGVVVSLLIVGIVILLTLEKLSGVKLRAFAREFVREFRTPQSQRPGRNGVLQPTAPPQRSSNASFYRQTSVTETIDVPVRSYMPQPVPDLPPSYDVALAITDPPPPYVKSFQKPAGRR